MNRTVTTRQTGFSLVEMMVAITIGLFILGGLAMLMANSRKNYEIQDYSARLQENARFASQFLSFDLRMAGYYGCSEVPPAGASPLLGITPADATYGDTLQIQYSDPTEPVMTITADSDPTATSVNLNISPVSRNVQQNDLVVISDCGGNIVRQVASVSSTSLALTTALGRYFKAGAQVRKLTGLQYSVAIGASGTPALFRGGQEIVEGVEFMRLLYGEDTDGDRIPNVYRPYDQVSTWAAVNSVKVGLLLRSVSNYNPAQATREYGTADNVDTRTYPILDLTGANAVDPADLRVQRRVFTTTVMARNL